VAAASLSDRGIGAAVDALARGGMVIVADGHDREDEGDLVMAASAMTPPQMAFYLRFGSGIVCVPMSDGVADRLELPSMVTGNSDTHQTAFTVSVDHRSVGTGISAGDRCLTVRALADERTRPADLRRPGHVFPLRARQGGVLKRAGHTEAAVDLLRMAGGGEVGVITELLDDDGVPLHGAEIPEFAQRHNLPFVCIDDLVRSRRATESLVTRSDPARLPLALGDFTAYSYRSALDGVEHLALTLGDVAAADRLGAGVLVRVHSECLTGDVFGSLRCDCGQQLQKSLAMIAAAGAGVVVYLRGQEGRGVGLSHKLRAYALQDRGADTVDANTQLGLPVDSREYGIGAAILADLGVHRARLITNNPCKYGGLGGHDLELVERVPAPVAVTPQNVRYLRTKRERMGHAIDLPTQEPRREDRGTQEAVAT
jgi:3,4-dihydroxy 2-butanone 4-phosphate synthase/GTP cyclohydrolase II